MAAAILASRQVLQVMPITEEEDTHVSVQSPDRNPQTVQDESPLMAWSVGQVSFWLERQGFSDLAQRAVAADVDGATLLELNAAAWAELGASTAVQCCKLIALVKKEQAQATGMVQQRAALPIATAAQDYTRGRAHENAARKFFTGGMNARNPDGGAEHNIAWVLAVANANRSPAEVKQHALRFLGMYNVITLLVLTMDMTYLMSAELEGAGPTSWANYVVFFLFALGAMYSGLGMVASTIMYNTASAISDSNFIVFVKLPCILGMFKLVNDTSIWSGNFTFFAIIFLVYRVCIDLTEGSVWRMYPGGPDVIAHWYYCIPILLVPCYTFAAKMPTFFHGIMAGTNLALYGGLLSADPVPPLKEDPTWAYRSSPEQVAEYLSSAAMGNGQHTKPKDCQVGIATHYAEQTVAAMAGEEAGEIPIAMPAGGEPSQLLASLSSLFTTLGSLGGGGGRMANKPGLVPK